MTMQPTIFQLSAVCKQRLELLKYSANGELNSYEGKVLKEMGSQFPFLVDIWIAFPQ